MKSPVRVVVTGAAGQIGYALLFRIAAGDMLGKDQPVILHLLEITPALPALNGVVMELNDCAFPTLAGIVATDDVNVGVQGCRLRLAGWRAPAWRRNGAQGSARSQRRDFLAAGQGPQRPCQTQRQGARGWQSGEHECADCAAECARPRSEQFYRDGAPGSQSRIGPAGRKNRRAHDRHQARDDLGQSQFDPVSGSVPRQREGRGGNEAGRRKLVQRPHLYPRCSNAVPRSSRRVAHRARPRPPLRQSITCAPGRKVRPRATGRRWAFRPTAATALRRA